MALSEIGMFDCDLAVLNPTSPLFCLVDATKEKEMMLEFFQLVNKKNALIRYESELVIR